MQTVDKLDIFLDGHKVGTMAPYQRYRTAFEYSDDWISNGYSLNPFSLPLAHGVSISRPEPFDGLFGVFADSLPDGWGRLLVDRMLRKMGERPEEIDPITRLAIVGSSGMGSLEYKPAIIKKSPVSSVSFDQLEEECKKILRSEESDNLDLLYSLGGSSGGARPKVMIRTGDEEWIVKFPASADPGYIGQMEYEYNLCASACGIVTPEVKLFSSEKCPGYFGSKRFDRLNLPSGIKKVHMVSASALLEISHRIPSLDYTSLMSLTWQLTKKADELLKLYRLMCFNVFAHNRDDHSNNFSYLCVNGDWSLAPAYDLTYSNSMGGEHATTIAGEGKDPSINDLLTVAKQAGIKESVARDIADNIRNIVNQRLSYYLKRSGKY